MGARAHTHTNTHDLIKILLKFATQLSKNEWMIIIFAATLKNKKAHNFIQREKFKSNISDQGMQMQTLFNLDIYPIVSRMLGHTQ